LYVIVCDVWYFIVLYCIVLYCPVLHCSTLPQGTNPLVVNNNNNVAIPGDRNVIKKEAENILKYKDHTIEIQRMWNVKTRVIPVIIGATGTISKSFRKYVSDIPGNHDVKELQKTAILGTAHILGKVLT